MSEPKYIKKYYSEIHNRIHEEYFQLNGKKEGEYKSYGYNGNVNRVYNYVNGKLHGEWKNFYDNGQLSSIGNYVDDKLQGEYKSYYDNGNLLTVCNYIDGKLHGEYKEYKNEQLYSICNYVMTEHNSIKEGEYKSYFENGKIRISSNYVGDKLHGEYKEYDINGKLLATDYFVNGVYTKTKNNFI